MNRFTVRNAAVLGAGVMGAQIAAHLANAGVRVTLYDLPAPGADPSAIARKAIDGLRKLEPAPLAGAASLALIRPANYDHDLPRLIAQDLVIEAIAERMEWKADLYHRIAPHLGAGTVIASNTSGLSIQALADALPPKLRPRFCGVHFFNPPRYMRLVELIASTHTEPGMLDELETWLTSRVGKGVVRALDTPNFVGNRVGVFSILSTMHHTGRLGLGFDEVDALTGPLIGRPKSATYRTADVVGLDTLAHVIDTMREQLPDDPWHPHYRSPAWLQGLIDAGALGQKRGAGIYKKVGRDILVLDLASKDYRPATRRVADEVAALLRERDPAKRLAALHACSHPQAQLLWSIFRDLFHYCAAHLLDVADNARDIDQALRWGYGWSQGPFETWQAAGWNDIARAVADDIAQGLAMSGVPLPAWALEPREGVHGPQGSYSARDGSWRPRPTLPVYQRQLLPERLLGEPPADPGETLWANEGVRLWRLPNADPRIAIASVISRNHTLGSAVIEGLHEAVTRAETDFDALVLHHDAPFSLGADLEQVHQACQDGEYELLEEMIGAFQQASLRLRDARVPVVAAVSGMALGGGCEFLMHARRRVLALESYIGLVEAGVGLIPAGGGSKALAVRAAALAAATATPGEVFPFLAPMFQNVALAQASKSALHAAEMGYALPADPIVFHPGELLYVALREARTLAEAGHRPAPPVLDIPVAGRTGIANFEAMLINMREGGQISAHDYRVARAAAVALCGGEVDAGTRVDENWLLAVERREFLALLRTPETQARIRHTLDTGKPLRN